MAPYFFWSATNGIEMVLSFSDNFMCDATIFQLKKK